MQLLNPQSALTSDERSQKRKLVVRDTVALLTLLIVTLALFTATVFLFRAFSDLRSQLAQRWLTRGEAAMHTGNPAQAVEDLRSALAYAPGQQSIEIELAEALAEAGRTQEATSYFTTLWEAEPGSGIINLQLARLAARQGNQSEALERYRAAIYGNWEGDGTIRRRTVRLELINYLIDIHRYCPGARRIDYCLRQRTRRSHRQDSDCRAYGEGRRLRQRQPDLQDNPAACTA